MNVGKDTASTGVRRSARSSRMSILLTPEVAQGISTLAKIEGRSVNDLIFSILERVVEKNSDVLKDFAVESQKVHAKYSAQLSLFPELDVDSDTSAK